MFKFLFILFLIKQLLSNVTSDIDLYSSNKVLSDKEKLSGGNSDGYITQTFPEFQFDDLIKN